VLLADDEPAIRDFVSYVLETNGYRVRAVQDGRGALAALTEALPDLVLLDVVMPHMDGRGVVAEMRARALTVPVILMTAVVQAGDVAAELGAIGYVSKPFDVDDLVAKVARVLGPLRAAGRGTGRGTPRRRRGAARETLAPQH
jgi:DNA-binding response OmpR family regulator